MTMGTAQSGEVLSPADSYLTGDNKKEQEELTFPNGRPIGAKQIRQAIRGALSHPEKPSLDTPLGAALFPIPVSRIMEAMTTGKAHLTVGSVHVIRTNAQAQPVRGIPPTPDPRGQFVAIAGAFDREYQFFPMPDQPE